jgi:hypothetical protein
MRIDYGATLDLTMEEITDLLDFVDEQRRAEYKAFGKGR